MTSCIQQQRAIGIDDCEHCGQVSAAGAAAYLDGLGGGVSVHDERFALVLHDAEVRLALLQFRHQALQQCTCVPT